MPTDETRPILTTCSMCRHLHQPYRNKTCRNDGRLGNPGKGDPTGDDDLACVKFKRLPTITPTLENDTALVNPFDSQSPIDAVNVQIGGAVFLTTDQNRREDGTVFGVLIRAESGRFLTLPAKIRPNGRIALRTASDDRKLPLASGRIAMLDTDNSREIASGTGEAIGAVEITCYALKLKKTTKAIDPGPEEREQEHLDSVPMPSAAPAPSKYRPLPTQTETPQPTPGITPRHEEPKIEERPDFVVTEPDGTGGDLNLQSSISMSIPLIRGAMNSGMTCTDAVDICVKRIGKPAGLGSREMEAFRRELTKIFEQK